MSKASYKGYKGEVEFAELLIDIFKNWNYEFVRRGGQERFKKIHAGDVVLDPRTDKNEKCFLRNYFLEAKKHATPDLWAIMREAEKNAKEHYKHGAIAYIRKSGEKRSDNGELIVMTPQTFKRIVVELQGFINGD